MLQTHTTGITYGKVLQLQDKGNFVKSTDFLNSFVLYVGDFAIARVKFGNFLTHLIPLTLMNLLA